MHKVMGELELKPRQAGIRAFGLPTVSWYSNTKGFGQYQDKHWFRNKNQTATRMLKKQICRIEDINRRKTELYKPGASHKVNSNYLLCQ